MKAFMDQDFLLSTPTARALYHDYAAKMPIIDYHCHLRPEQIAQDMRYDSITQVWLGGDHYKWRAMRGAGIEEKYITGDAGDWEKFRAWAAAMPRCIGNPLYHWTHLELQRFFGITEPLNPESAARIYKQCNEMLADPAFSARGLIARSGVEVLCTTDDPADDLASHIALAADTSFKTRVLPTYRPDKAINIHKPDFAAYIAKLSAAANMAIAGLDDLKAALTARMDFFAGLGCVISDHALDTVPDARPDDAAADAALRAALAGGQLTPSQIAVYRATVMVFLGKEYARRGWAMQLHIAAMRDINSRMFARLGPDTGYDAIEDAPIGHALAALLDEMDREDLLPKTILYSLNPVHNDLLISIATSFNQGPTVGKVQFGSAWWFNDQMDGMKRQMTTLASIGLLSGFVGMLTDSRSFMSYPRHEYFRRILCEMIGTWAENGEVPADMALLGGIVQDISYNNAKKYFFGA